MSFHELLLFLQELGANLLGLYLYQDYIEVTLFILATYKTLTWLKQDHTKQLVLGSYAYFCTLSLSYYFSCTILFSTLLVLTPALIAFAIIIHQKQLQRNFILPSKKYVTPQAIPHKNWFNILIQSCLQVSHQQKHITCIIERTDHLFALLQAPFVLQLPIQQDITKLILSSNSVNNDSILWINQSGIMHSINVVWKPLLIEETFISDQTKQSVINHEAATLLTAKTDALVFEINASTNTHTIWYQGKCMQNTTVQELLLFVKEVLRFTHTPKSLIKRNVNDQANRPTP